jgi:hypothetical protein
MNVLSILYQCEPIYLTEKKTLELPNTRWQHIDCIQYISKTILQPCPWILQATGFRIYFFLFFF